jgi:hypothetical protein
MSIIYALVGTNRVLRHSNSITIKLLSAISIVFGFFGTPCRLYNKQKNTWVLGNTRFISRIILYILYVRGGFIVNNYSPKRKALR